MFSFHSGIEYGDSCLKLKLQDFRIVWKLKPRVSDSNHFFLIEPYEFKGFGGYYDIIPI